MADRIAVMGAGAVGAHIGGHLSRVGYDVTLIDPWPAHVDAMNADGLVLSGLTEPENVMVPVKAIHLSQLQSFAGRGFDLVFLATKSYDTRWAATMMAGYLVPGGFIVSAQNGINEPTIAEVVGWPRVAGVIVSKIAVELHAPGRVRRLVKLGGPEHLVFRVGEPHGRITQRIQKVAEMLTAVDSADVTTNLWGERWTKLGVNCMRNPTAAASGRGGNANDRDEMTRRLSIRLAGETVKIAWAHGVELERLYGIKPEDLARAHGGDPAAMGRCEEIILETMLSRSDEQRPSMGQDIYKGRRTEIDQLNGFAAARAEEVGLAAPLNAGIADIVRRVERGDVAASPDLLTRLANG